MLTYHDDPFVAPLEACRTYEPDAVIVMEDGLIQRAGPAGRILPQLDPALRVQRYPDSLILPGFIDAHTHYPQTPMIAAPARDLQDWLTRHTFRAEQAFADPGHAARVADVFLQELFRNGTTAAMVFCSVHPASVDALFTAARPYDMRIMAGKVCMDRHAPGPLLDTPQRAYEESSELIARWHGQGRAEYVLTPRFAPTSSDAQLARIGELAQAHPDMLIQSHLAETRAEVDLVASLFPDDASYTAVYARHHLLRPRALYGHGIHLNEAEWRLLHETGAGIAHCPTANFFLGSGAFHLRTAKNPARPVRVGLGTDIGAGTSFSLLQTLNEAYKAAQSHGGGLTAGQAFYLAGRGTAEALGLADRIGSIAPGLEADLTVLHLKSTPLIAYRMQQAGDLDDALFIQMTLADDRAIAATYVAGRAVHVA
jgi:guanine deaminase